MQLNDTTLLLLAILLLGMVGANIAVWVAMLIDQRRERARATVDKVKHETPVHKTKDLLPRSARRELEEHARQRYATMIDHSAMKLAGDLTSVAKSLTKHMEQKTTDVIEREVAGYRKVLEAERAAASKTLAKIEQAVETEQDAAKKQAEQDAARHAKALAKAVDARFSDIVGSYLVETLGDAAEISDPKPLLAGLERQKEQLKKDLLRDY